MTLYIDAPAETIGAENKSWCLQGSEIIPDYKAATEVYVYMQQMVFGTQQDSAEPP